jgi:hypothetical protein
MACFGEFLLNFSRLSNIIKYPIYPRNIYPQSQLQLMDLGRNSPYSEGCGFNASGSSAGPRACSLKSRLLGWGNSPTSQLLFTATNCKFSQMTIIPVKNPDNLIKVSPILHCLILW